MSLLEENNFLTPLRFFEYHIIEALKSLPENHGISPSLSTPCQFNSVCTRSKKNIDLTVKICEKKLGIEDLGILKIVKDVICQHPILQKYLLFEAVDQFGKINFTLHRKNFMRDVCKLVLSNGVNYGQARQSSDIGCNYILLDNANILSKSSSGNGEVLLGSLYNLLLCNHAIKILTHNSSNDVRFCTKTDNLFNIHEHFAITFPDTPSTSPVKVEATKEWLKTRLLESKYHFIDDYKIWDDEQTRKTITSDACIPSPCETNVYEDNYTDNHRSSFHFCDIQRDNYDSMILSKSKLNLSQYLEDRRKNYADKEKEILAFDENIKEVKVSSIWEGLMDLVMQGYFINDSDSVQVVNRKIIHICGQESKFKVQQFAVALRSLSKRDRTNDQVIFCHNSIKLVNNAGHDTTQSVMELVRVRTKQIKHSYFMKYGAVVNDEKWTKTIAKISTAVITLEILTTPLKHQVQLDVTETNECPNSCRQSLFILYNCARLSKMLEHYNNAVENGLYSSLPEVEMIDFTLLKDEAEWSLFMKYIVCFPDVVAEVRESLESFTKSASFKSNKIAQFLVSLSKDISVYYSRVHILGECKTHLFPLMFARLYLIKALYQVMKNALWLLGIEPVEQM